MKKLLILFMVAVLSVSGLAGCSQSAGPKAGQMKIVCTTFPQYDWVRQILGDRAKGAELTLLLDNGADLHNYQPTTGDIVKISQCDLFIYVGGESDEWVDDVLRSANNKKMDRVNLLEALGDAAKAEELLDGMEHDHDHEEEHDEDRDHEEEHKEEEHGEEEHHDGEETKYDEHIWLSLKNALKLCGVLTDKICALDEKNAAEYKQNYVDYTELIDMLDSDYQTAVGTAARKSILFCDRFPFFYMTSDYSLTPYAAFSGCSAEVEASFDTVAFLAKKVDELKLPYVLIIDGSDKSLANTVIATTKDKNQQILSLNSMQSITAKDVKEGVSYLSIMKDNLSVLKKALN